MSVHKVILRSGKPKWQVRWREADKNRSRNFDATRAGRKLADQFDNKLREMRQAGELAAELDRRRITIEDLCADWLERRMPGLSDKTAKNYGVQLDLRIMPKLAHRRVSQLTVRDVEAWIAWMRADGAGDPTILKACTVLQALLTMAVEDGIVAVNVARQARKPKQSRQRIPYLVKPIAVERMRAWMLDRGWHDDVLLLDLLAYAGLRPESEAVRLPRRLVRDRSMIVQDTKRGRERTIVLLAALRDSLAAGGRDGRGELVVMKAKGYWTEHDWRNWRRRRFRPAALAAGLPADVRPRDLRGSFVSLLVGEGRSIVEVARQTGHSAEVCLRDYAQVFDEFDPAGRKPADQVIAEARLAVRIASMRAWATTIEWETT